MHLFPILKETDGSKPDWQDDASLARTELNAGARPSVVVWSRLICIHHRVRMCQRVCLLPCLASVKAVYIGLDGGGNSAQLPSSPRPHAEQWTEPAVICIHYTHRWVSPVLKTRATGAASWDSRCYCRVRLFQLNMNTNQTWFQAGLLRTVSPQSKYRNTSDLGLLRLKSAVWFFLRCFSVFISSWKHHLKGPCRLATF